jgi:hypothetical protein
LTAPPISLDSGRALSGGSQKVEIEVEAIRWNQATGAPSSSRVALRRWLEAGR